VHKLLFTKMPKQEKNALSRELVGTLYLSLSIILACSLFSYFPKDVHSTESLAGVHNWFGIFGAYLAFGLYSALGWASNLLPLLALYLGGACLFRRQFSAKQSALWVLGFVLVFTCLLQVSFSGPTDWGMNNKNLATRWDNPTRGIAGMWGLYIGTNLFQSVFGRIGSVITFGLASGICFFMAMQMQPQAVYEWTLELFRQRKLQKRAQALRSGDIKTVLRTREEEIVERQRLIERELSRRGKKNAHGKRPGTRRGARAGARPRGRGGGIAFSRIHGDGREGKAGI